MSNDTTYVSKSVPVVDAPWLNDVNIAVYRALGAAGVAPTTAAQVLANLGLSGAGGAGLIDYNEGGTGAVTRTVQNVLQNDIWLSVLNFPANGTSGAPVDVSGVLDSTAGIQLAINDLIALGGGTVSLPPGTFKISSTLNITASNVKLVGAGSGSFHYIPNTNDAATKFYWVGGAAPIVKFDPGYPTNTKWLSDCRFDGIFLMGGGVATVGLQINSCRNGWFRAFGQDCITNICQLGIGLPGGPLSDTADCQQNYVEVEGNQSQGLASNGGLLRLDGQSYSFTGYSVGSLLTVTAIGAGNYIPINAVLLVGTGTSSTSSGVKITSYGTGNGSSTGTYNLSGTPSQLYSSGSPGTYGISNADASSNLIKYVDGNVYNGNAIVFGNTDNNSLENARIFIQGPGTAGFSGTGRGLVFLAGGYNQSARLNTIFHLSIASVNAYPSVIAQGTESGSSYSYGNFLTYVDPLEGGGWVPACGTLAQLFYTALNGYYPAVRATTQNNTSQVFNSGTPTTVVWDNASGNYDLLGNFASNTFTAPKWGIYDVSVTLSSAGAMVAGDRYQLDISVVGTFGTTASTQWTAAISSDVQSFLARGKMQMASGDTLTVLMSRQQGSGSFSPAASSSNNRLEINYISQSA